MEINPYEYNTNLPRIPQQNQVNEAGVVNAKFSQQQLSHSKNQGLPQRNVGQKPRTPEKMPKARALALANMLKRTLAVASIIGFGMFGGLVAMHQVGTTTTQSTQSTKSSSGSSNTSSTSSSSSQNSNNFLKQQGGNTSGTSSSSTNSSSTSSSSSTPVTGTSTS